MYLQGSNKTRGPDEEPWLWHHSEGVPHACIARWTFSGQISEMSNSTINNVLRQVVCEHKLMKNYKDFLLKVYINCMISYGTIFWFAVKSSLFRVTFKIHVAIHLELAQNALQKPFSMSCMLLTCVSVKNHSFHGLMNSINWPASSVWVFIGQAGRALQR